MTWTLNAGDCLGPEGLATLADDSVDVACFDPPYSEHVHASCRGGLTARDKHKDPSASKISRRTELGFKAADLALIAGTAAQCARLVRRWSIAFSDVESCHLWREAFENAGLDYIRTLFWDKLGGAPQFTGDRPAVACETMTLAHRRGRKRWSGGGKRGIYTCSIALAQRGEERFHPTQKPLALMEALLRDFAEPGEMILDPFAGSGTTGVAARRLGMSFIGWERDEKFAADAHRRIDEAREQGSLFAKTKKAEQLALGVTNP